MSEPQHQMTVSVTERDGAPLIVAAGELDVATVDRFEQAVRSTISGAATVRVDLAGVTFADSTALGVLVALHESAVEDGTVLCVSAVSDVVDALLHISGLSDELRC